MAAPDDKTVTARSAPVDQPEPSGGSDSGDAGRTEFNPHAFQSYRALPPGTQLGEFRIVGLIGEGGFGIVYLAHDTQLDRRVALKEFMPAALANRSAHNALTVESRNEEIFRAGLRSFINEARVLAQFDHHSLVRVYRFWEANGTAYMVMPYYEGITLRDAVRASASPPDEAWLRNLLVSLTEALAVLHAAHCYHRDIAPDNILLSRPDGRPVLLDFGAARRVVGDMTQTLTAILKAGYAPIEQYAEIPSMKQGPWTDIYALAAVVYYIILRRTPPPAVSRVLHDEYVPLVTAAAGQYPERLLRTIDHALAVRPEERPQSVQALAAELGLAAFDVETVQVPRTAPLGARRPPEGQTGPPPSAALATGGSVAVGEARTTVRPLDEVRTTVRPAEEGATNAPAVSVAPVVDPVAAPPRRRGAWWGALGVAVVAVAAGGFWLMRGPSPVTPSGESAPTVAATPPPSPSPPQQVQATPATPAAPAMAPPPAPRDPLDRLASGGDPAMRVTVALASPTARIGKDRLQFRLRSAAAGHVYVFLQDPSGQVVLLFPNRIDGDNAITAGASMTLPRPNWPLRAAEPAGQHRFVVMVSRSPRDFSGAGLAQASAFGQFPADAALAGEPRCAPAARACPGDYGAASFAIDVVKR